jgi:hypothetical protein
MAKNFNVRGKMTVIAHTARNLTVKQLIGEVSQFLARRGTSVRATAMHHAVA